MPLAHPSSFQFSSSGPLRLYNTDELLRLPPPTWQIEPVIPAGGLVGLYGPPGCGKSFIALDMALSLASHTAWQGRAVEGGLVLYVSAEGTAGLGQRVKAWLLGHDRATTGQDVTSLEVSWLTEAVPIYAESTDLETLFARFDEVGVPELVILDTLARCFDGDENMQNDMGRFVAGVDKLRHECAASVLVVHHTNVDGGRERGSTALRGAADTMIRVIPGVIGVHPGGHLRPPQGTFSIICDKQKDAEPFPIGLGHLVGVPDARSCYPVVEWLTAEEEKSLGCEVPS